MTVSTNSKENSFNNWQVKSLANSEIEIRGEIETDDFASFRVAALKRLNANTNLAGFRSGHIPEETLERHLGEATVLQEMAEMAANDFYPKLLKAKQIDALGSPQVTITKLAKGNPLGLIIKTAVLPTFSLGDYRAKIKTVAATKIDPLPVTEEEITKIITDLEIKNPKAPELADKQELKTKLRAQLEGDRTREAKEKRRLVIIEELIKQTPFELPAILIDSEADRLMDELKSSLERFGLKFEDYLNHLKKTEADLRLHNRPEAEKRVRIHLLLGAIIKAEALTVDQKEQEKLVQHLKSHYPELEQAKIEAYAEQELLISLAWQKLENV